MRSDYHLMRQTYNMHRNTYFGYLKLLNNPMSQTKQMSMLERLEVVRSLLNEVYTLVTGTTNLYPPKIEQYYPITQSTLVIILIRFKNIIKVLDSAMNVYERTL